MSTTKPPQHLQPVFDPDTLEQLSELIDGEDASFLEELFQSYLETAAETIATLRASQDGDTLMRAAHTLKGSSLNVGATRVAAICRELELQLRRGPAGNLRAAVSTIETQVAQVQRSYPTTVQELAVRASA